MAAHWTYSSNIKDKMFVLSSAAGLRSDTHVQELFHEEAQQISQTQTKPWWKIQLFVWEPVLFGTWDGVFTSCMINIFGVVLFLRTGWLVGNTGILMGMFLVSFVVVVALVTVLSGIGVCERCSIGSGGVYSMISTVLGGQVGGTIGLLYIFGQCVAGAMYITGFAESISDLLGFSSTWAVRGISLAVLLGLLGINLAGVKWIIRLQLLLLFLLAVSTLDFVIGSFTHLDPEHGFVGYSKELMFNNTLPDYSTGESFFTVFGVFFPAATGVMAGFNMSGDLQKPAASIPLGSLAAIGISWFLYIVFVFLLGAICTRESLRYDFMIAEKVSLVGFLFLLGLYISSLASCMGGLYGAPRILQCIAQEKVISTLAFLGHGKGRNKTPVAAICLTSLITMAFVFVGQVNILAPIVTINFMLTYIAVDYSYFSVSMSYILQQKPKRTQREESRVVNSSQPLTFEKTSRYGSDGIIQSRSDGTLLEFTKDMDQLFKPLNKDPGTHKEKEERDKNLNQKVKQRKIKKPAKQTLQDSFLLDLDHNIAPAPYCCTKTSEPSDESLQSFAEQSHQSERNLCLSSAVDTEQKRDHELMEYGEQLFNELQNPPNQKVEDTNVKQQNQELEIQRMPVSFYARFCNHWVSLVGAIGSLVIMFVIQWIYTLINLSVAIILYFYIGQMSPGLPPGAAANFSFLSWIKLGLVSSCRRRPSPEEQIVVTPSFATVGMETTQLTEENADFASRDRYHHSSVIRREEFVNQFQ
ncbi:potassium voltage-gated channel subfamily E member 2 [Platysternon megacephalum]|uniref:Solute carrier family 12 member 8 n=1 Tax=Platysternon megacephalum TaxID=55544 RepID=A0A4D9EIE6_9SAUR|nr:potassium voltage-gated channel subfamily E member 2 [Platysternon megacephalum]